MGLAETVVLRGSRRIEDLLTLAEPWQRLPSAAALIHLPSPERMSLALLASGSRATVAMLQGGKLAQHILVVLRAFRHLEVDLLPETTQGTLSLGRAAEVSLMLDDPSVSKLHATLRWGPEGFFLKDNGSTNGTFVNGVQLAAERRLCDGDAVCLADAQLLFVTTSTLQLQLASLMPS